MDVAAGVGGDKGGSGSARDSTRNKRGTVGSSTDPKAGDSGQRGSAEGRKDAPGSGGKEDVHKAPGDGTSTERPRKSSELAGEPSSSCLLYTSPSPRD